MADLLGKVLGRLRKSPPVEEPTHHPVSESYRARLGAVGRPAQRTAYAPQRDVYAEPIDAVDDEPSPQDEINRQKFETILRQAEHVQQKTGNEPVRPAKNPDVIELGSAPPPVEQPRGEAPEADSDAPLPENVESGVANRPASIQNLYVRHRRPALALHRPWPPRNLPKLRSHIGGLPDLPGDVAWPRASEGEKAPLHFLAQIDLAEHPWLPERFPVGGTLMFFGMLDDACMWDERPDCSRVIFDPASSGAPVMPPDDLSTILNGRNDYQMEFGEDDWLRCRTLPEWPLIGGQIETMPDGDAFEPDSIHSPKLHGYHEALSNFRATEAARIAGVDLDALADWAPPRHGAISAQPGFPWCPRFVELWCLAARQDGARLDRDELQDCLEWARSRPADERIAMEEAELFRQFIRSEASGSDRRDRCLRVLKRLVKESGASQLASILPDLAFALVEDQHRPVRRSSSRGGQTAWEIRHHQMGGFVPFSQHHMPLDADYECLLQLQSDPGSDMVFCNFGEADFWIKPERLARADFSEVIGDRRGK